MFGLNLFARTPLATVPDDIVIERSWQNVCPAKTEWVDSPVNDLTVRQCQEND